MSAQAPRVFSNSDDSPAFDPSQGDLYVYPLHNEPLLDGYREDWGIAAEPQPLPPSGLGARVLAAATERYLFLYLEVDDPNFTPEPNDAHPDKDKFDRVDLTLQRPDGSLESLFLATGAPGLIQAQSTVKSGDGVDHAAPQPRIQAFWLQTSRGYHLETRIPRNMLGSRVWLEAIDGAGVGRAGFLAYLNHYFEKTPAVPAAFLPIFATALPPVETALGVLLLLGVGTRLSLIAGGLVMAALVVGTNLAQDWNVAGLQLIYCFIYYYLLAHRRDLNRISLDAVIGW